MRNAPTAENRMSENAAKATASKKPSALLPVREHTPRSPVLPVQSNRAALQSRNDLARLRPSQMPVLQRKCACDGSAGKTDECMECSAQSESCLTRETE